MYSEIFGNVSKQLEGVTAPARKMQEAYVEHLASLTEFHVEALRGYTELGLNHLRAVQGVQDPQALISSQTELLKTLGERANQDASTLTKIQQDYASQVQGLTAESVKTAEVKAEKPVRKAASTTSRAASKKTA